VRLWPAGLASSRPGVLLQQLGSDVDAAVEVLARFGLPLAAVVLAGSATTLFLTGLLPALGPVLVAGLVVVLLVAPAVQHVLAGRAALALAPLRAELSAQSVDLVHGLPDLTAYGAVEDRLARLRTTDARLRREAGRAAASTGLGTALVTLAGGACVVAALAFGAGAVHIGALDPVLLAVVVLTPLALFEAASVLPAAGEQAAGARSALRRLFAVLARPDPVPDPAVQVPLPGPPYHVRMESVAARWRDDAPLALTGLDLDLPPGRRVALVGPSGSGKSTAAALLARLLDPVRGRITLNGVDLRSYPGDQVREVVTLLDSDAHLFDTTIEANLRLGRPSATADELRQALAAARLTEWVEGLPDGLATRVGEDGGLVSGGERRRLALARALLRDTPVLVLDEPTEHLDEATARTITEDLLAATRGRTLVLITHRPHGLDLVDEVITLPAPPP
jgi:thiol reductant ABC exporter CydC subunit